MDETENASILVFYFQHNHNRYDDRVNQKFLAADSKGLFTRSEAIPVTVEVYHCANGDGQNGVPDPFCPSP